VSARMLSGIAMACSIFGVILALGSAMLSRRWRNQARESRRRVEADLVRIEDATAPVLAWIWSNQHRAWWRSYEQGYTTVHEWAGLYPIEQARGIVAEQNRYGMTAVSDNNGVQPDSHVPNEVVIPRDLRDLRDRKL